MSFPRKTLRGVACAFVIAGVIAGIIAGLPAFIPGDYSGSRAFAQAPDPEIAAATEAYRAGDGLKAEAILSRYASGPIAPGRKLSARLLLAQFCDEMNDFACFQDNNVELLKLLAQWDAQSKPAALAQITPWIVRQQFLARDFKTLDLDAQIVALNVLPAGALPAPSYLALQMSAADYAVLKSNRAQARAAVSRLAARAAAMAEGPTVLAQYIAQIVDAFHVLRDDYDATRFLLKFDDFLSRELPKNSIRTIRYWELSASLLAELATEDAYKKALARLAAARGTLNAMNVAPDSRNEELSQIAVAESEIFIAQGDMAGAAAAELRNPLQAKRKALQNEPEFDDAEELYFCVMDLFLDRSRQKTPDAGWSAILNASKFGEDSEENLEPYKAYRAFGRALLAKQGSADWRSFVVRAADDDIAHFEASLDSDARAFPLANAVDRAIVGQALSTLAQTGDYSPVEKRIIVRGVDFLQRSIRARRGDDLFRVAAGASLGQRRQIHAALLAKDRRTDSEMEALATRISAASAGPAYLAVEPAANDTDGVQTRPLPGPDEISAALAKDEAFVSETAWENTLLKLCVAPGRFAFVATPLTPEANGQVKLVRAALTADNAPSDELDSQYPVGAAMAVNALALGGLESCIGDAKTITFSAAPFMADIPLAALLESAPPRTDKGYDLEAAAWLAKKYQFAYVTSAEDFVAAKRLFAGATDSSDQSFLGIGDPVLQGRQIGAPGGAPIGLAELPDTGTELKAIAAIVPAAQLLMREDASEERVRSAGLERFRVLEFATHGLLGSDADALAEPGLVLTPKPVPSGDPADDGFLSAGEISAFDLSARLVVLSACNTANFETEKFNGGIRGLTASFALAGVPSTLASLWAVDSPSSARLMALFFAALVKGQDRSVSAALATAERQFLGAPPSNAYAHPRFWAAFSVYGDGTTPLLLK